jgi:hypothetical protein
VQPAVFLPLPQLDLASPRYYRRIVVHCLEVERGEVERGEVERGEVERGEVDP